MLPAQAHPRQLSVNKALPIPLWLSMDVSLDQGYPQQCLGHPQPQANCPHFPLTAEQEGRKSRDGVVCKQPGPSTLPRHQCPLLRLQQSRTSCIPLGIGSRKVAPAASLSVIYLFIGLAISLALRRLYLSLISDTKEVAGSQGR